MANTAALPTEVAISASSFAPGRRCTRLLVPVVESRPRKVIPPTSTTSMDLKIIVQNMVARMLLLYGAYSWWQGKIDRLLPGPARSTTIFPGR